MGMRRIRLSVRLSRGFHLGHSPLVPSWGRLLGQRACRFLRRHPRHVSRSGAWLPSKPVHERRVKRHAGTQLPYASPTIVRATTSLVRVSLTPSMRDYLQAHWLSTATIAATTKATRNPPPSLPTIEARRRSSTRLVPQTNTNASPPSSLSSRYAPPRRDREDTRSPRVPASDAPLWQPQITTTIQAVDLH